MRIQLTRPTVKALEALLQKMVKFNQVKLVRRISALLEHLHQHFKVEEVAHKWGVSPAAIYHWVKQFILKGLSSLHYDYKGGRRPKLSLLEQKKLTQLLDGGPEAGGFKEDCWNSALVQELINCRPIRQITIQSNICSARPSAKAPTTNILLSLASYVKR